MRYEQAITDAAVAVTRASSGLNERIAAAIAGPDQRGIGRLYRVGRDRGAPITARATRRVVVSVGGIGLMQSTILPDAQQLYQATSTRVDSETTASTQIPAPVILVVATTVAFGALSHRWLARRTRRRINPGLVVGALGIS